MEVYIKPSKALGEGCEPAGEVKTMESLRRKHLSWDLQGQESARQLSQWLSDGKGILDTGLRQLRHWNLWGFIISNTWPVTQLTAHRGISVRQPHCEANFKHGKNLFRLSERGKERESIHSGEAAPVFGPTEMKPHLEQQQWESGCEQWWGGRGSRTWWLTRWGALCGGSYESGPATPNRN